MSFHGEKNRKVNQGYDIGDLFEASFYENPHLYWAKLRQKTPIAWSSHLGAWLIITYDAAIEALTNNGLTTDIYGQYRPSPVPIPSSFELDTSQHRQFRRLVRSRLDVTKLPMKAIAESCQIVKRSLPLDTRLDFVTQFAEPLADLLVERWLGISTERRHNLVNLLQIAEFDTEPIRRQIAGEIVIEELLLDISERRTRPTPNLLSELALAWTEWEADDLDLIAFIAPLLFSLVQRIGTRLVTHAVLAISTWSSLQEEIRRRGYDAARQVAIETARWEPITQIIPRRAKDTVCISGQSINPGDNVLIILTSVCRDSKFHPQPDSFKINRQERSLAFGYGIHACLGRELALAVAATAILHLLTTESVPLCLHLLSSPKYKVEFGRACISLDVILSKYFE
jgi:pimeloyl-[acyl-carrier protein] synthase